MNKETQLNKKANIVGKNRNKLKSTIKSIKCESRVVPNISKSMWDQMEYTSKIS
jgi:hypothetical protein